MTTTKRSTKRTSVEALVAGDHDLMKSLVKEALQEVLEGEMTEFLGAAPGERTEERQGYGSRTFSNCRRPARQRLCQFTGIEMIPVPSSRQTLRGRTS